MVERHVDVAAAARLGHVALDAEARRLGLLGGREAREAHDAVNLEARVHLGELLEQAREDDVLEGRHVARRVRVGLELGQDGLDLARDGQGVEVDLEDLVQLAQLGRDALEDVAREGVVEEAAAGRGRAEADERREAVQAALALALVGAVDALGRLDARAERDGERGEEHARRHLVELGVGAVGAAGEGDARGVERVELAVRGGVEQKVLADGKDLCHLVVEGRHDRGLGGALAHADEGVDVLGGAERLLPQLELDGRVELLEARVEVALERVGLVEVDRVRLVRVLLRRREVRAERLAQAAELGLALVLQAELERLVADRLWCARGRSGGGGYSGSVHLQTRKDERRGETRT